MGSLQVSHEKHVCSVYLSRELYCTTKRSVAYDRIIIMCVHMCILTGYSRRFAPSHYYIGWIACKRAKGLHDSASLGRHLTMVYNRWDSIVHFNPPFEGDTASKTPTGISLWVGELKESGREMLKLSCRELKVLSLSRDPDDVDDASLSWCLIGTITN